MKKGISITSGLFAGLALAGQVSAQDMGSVNSVNLAESSPSILVETVGNTKAAVMKNLKGIETGLYEEVVSPKTNTNSLEKYDIEFSPKGDDAVDLKGKLNIYNNMGFDFGITQTFNKDGNNDTIGNIGFKYLWDSVNTGTYISFEKGSEFQKIVASIVKGYDGGKIILTVAQLDKLTSVYFGEVDKTFSDVMTQSYIGVKASYELSKFVDEIRGNISYYNSNTIDFGKIGTSTLDGNDYFGAIKGGKNIQVGGEVDLKLTNNLVFTLSAGLENYLTKDKYTPGVEDTNLYYKGDLVYQLTEKNEIGVTYSRDKNVEEHGIKWLHRLSDSLDWTIGYMQTNNLDTINSDSKFFINLKYHFGEEKSISKSLDENKNVMTLREIKHMNEALIDRIKIKEKALKKGKTSVEKTDKYNEVSEVISAKFIGQIPKLKNTIYKGLVLQTDTDFKSIASLISTGGGSIKITKIDDDKITFDWTGSNAYETEFVLTIISKNDKETTVSVRQKLNNK